MDEFCKKLGGNTAEREDWTTRKFVFVLIKNFSLLAFCNAIEPLRIANRIAKKKTILLGISLRVGS